MAGFRAAHASPGHRASPGSRHGDRAQTGLTALLTRARLACTQAAPAGERVAQPVEHLTFNQRVSGSNPDALTKDLLNLHISVQSQVADLRTWRASANAATVLVLQVVEKNDLEAND